MKEGGARLIVAGKARVIIIPEIFAAAGGGQTARFRAVDGASVAAKH
jgi:hypothetical protein